MRFLCNAKIPFETQVRGQVTILIKKKFKKK